MNIDDVFLYYLICFPMAVMIFINLQWFQTSIIDIDWRILCAVVVVVCARYRRGTNNVMCSRKARSTSNESKLIYAIGHSTDTCHI